MKKNIEIDNLPSDVRAQYKRFKVMHAEKKIQRKAKDDFMSFTKAVWPEFIEGAHHRVIAQKFNDLANKKINRLIINKSAPRPVIAPPTPAAKYSPPCAVSHLPAA